MTNKKLRILGTRGVPAAHGGFETFAEHLAVYLQQQGWQVTVYCQACSGNAISEDTWRGIRRVHVPVTIQGAISTVLFDWKSTWHACRESGLVLTLGYNTAVFGLIYRFTGTRNIINMDGIEWRRQKWPAWARFWLWLNDWLGCFIGNHLIADHPEIKALLSGRVSPNKIAMIPYGADCIKTHAPEPYGLRRETYAVVIARAEPENLILDMVRAWSRKTRKLTLVVLGDYQLGLPYQLAVKAAASDEVLFTGAIYDKEIVQALRVNALFYLHGHTVGGTNPSLVEALGAGNAIVAHDNPFNRWVAGDAALYFSDEDGCAAIIDTLLTDDKQLAKLKSQALRRHQEAFTWEKTLAEYQALFEQWI